MNIYIGNLSRTVTEAKLRELFEQYGKVTSIKLIIDKFTGEPKGFAFVEMPAQEEAQAAIAALNGFSVEGQSLRVNEARPREDRPRSFGGNRGGSSGGGFGGERRGPRPFGSSHNGGSDRGWGRR